MWLSQGTDRAVGLLGGLQAVMKLLGYLFKAIAAFLGFESQQSGLKNSPAMQAAALAAQEQAAADKAAQAIARQDVKELRNDLAE